MRVSREDGTRLREGAQGCQTIWESDGWLEDGLEGDGVLACLPLWEEVDVAGEGLSRLTASMVR